MFKKILKGLLFTTLLFSILAFTPPTANYTADAPTVLLIHGDQADGTAGTDILDSETTPKVITAEGNAQVDTAVYKIGSGATPGSIMFDGTEGGLILDNSTDWDFGSSDLSLETFINWDNVASDRALIAHYASGGNRSWMFWFYNNAIHFQWSLDGTNSYDARGAFTPNNSTWYHLAVERNGDNLLFFADGTLLTTLGDSIAGVTIYHSTANVRIGRQNTGDYCIDGYMDEIRVSKGIARWVTVTRRLIMITYGVDMGSPNQIGTPLWSCKIKLQCWLRNLRS